jgi:hypothetical protein
MSTIRVELSSSSSFDSTVHSDAAGLLNFNLSNYLGGLSKNASPIPDLLFN